MNSQRIGSAKIQATSPKPSIDLVTLVELLAKSVPPKENRTNITALHPDYKQAFDLNTQNQRLRLCSSALEFGLIGI